MSLSAGRVPLASAELQVPSSVSLPPFHTPQKHCSQALRHLLLGVLYSVQLHGRTEALGRVCSGLGGLGPLQWMGPELGRTLTAS